VEFGPLIATAAMTRLPVPVLVTVTVCALLLAPRGSDPKVMLREDKDTEPELKLPTRLAALTVPIPVAKSHPVAAAKAGSYPSLVFSARTAHFPPVPAPPLSAHRGMLVYPLPGAVRLTAIPCATVAEHVAPPPLPLLMVHVGAAV
jgi:hypothetical protein